MSKVNLNSVTSLSNATTAINTINSNSAATQAGFDNTLSLDGTSPNQMGAALDMNNNRIINLPSPVSANEPLRLNDYQTLKGGGNITFNGLPTGGTTNQFLAKNSNTNFDTKWTNNPNSIYVNVKDFGALGNGVHDDTVAINAAYATLVGTSGCVFFPPGNYQISDTIKIGVQNGTNITSFISTYTTGGQDGTQLRWVGPNNKLVVGYYKNKGSAMHGISIVNQNGATGCTGLGLGGYGPGDFGNSSLGNVFQRVQSFGFDTAGISGINFGCGSECVFNQCNFDGNVYGFTHSDFNSLDFLFLECGFGHSIGYDTGSSGGPHVIIGGSTSQIQIAVFNIQSIADKGTFIEGYRSEDSGLGLPSGQNAVFLRGAGGKAVVSNCVDYTPKQGVSVSGLFSNLAIRDCLLGGWVMPNRGTEPTNGFLEITNCTLPVDPNTNLPFIGTPAGRVKCKSNRDLGAVTMCLDFEGSTSSEQHTNVYPFACGYFLPDVLQINELDRLAIPTNTGKPYGASQTGLCYVRHLSEGPLPGMFREGAPDSLTTTGLTGAAGNNYLTYTGTLPTTFIPGMILQNGSNTSLDNLSVTYTDTTSKVVGLSGNVTGAGTSSGQTIRYFFNVAEALTRGKNLRIQSKFASSGTLSIPFTRTLTVTCSGTPKVTANTGQFFPSDAGKPISVAGGGANGWTDWIGQIGAYVDSTHVIILSPVSVSSSNFTSLTATIGENEPDGNYMVIVTGDSNETFWVTNITSTGFTVHSSNASSTATVTCLIIR